MHENKTYKKQGSMCILKVLDVSKVNYTKEGDMDFDCFISFQLMF